MRLRLRWMAGAVAALMITIGSARAEMVVIASTAPEIDTGLIVVAGDRLTVPDGAMVTLVDRTGRSVTINGPFSDVADAPAEVGGNDVMVAVASLISAQDEYEEFGATRGVRIGDAGAAGRSSGAAADIDVSTGGVYCVGAGSTPQLWRADSTNPATYELASRAGGTRARVAFAAGAMDAAWPGAIAPAGEIEIKRLDRAAAPATVMFKSVRDDAASEPERIAALLAVGCDRQAAIRAAAFRAEVAPLSLYLTSDRGRDAQYQLGETMTLIAQASRDVYLYCFYRDSAGAVVTLFPSRYSKGARVRGNISLALPGERLPVTLQFTAPPGREQIACYATERDMGDRLPKAVTAGAFEALSPARAAEVEAAFAEMAGSGLAQAKVDILVQ